MGQAGSGKVEIRIFRNFAQAELISERVRRVNHLRPKPFILNPNSLILMSL